MPPDPITSICRLRKGLRDIRVRAARLIIDGLVSPLPVWSAKAWRSVQPPTSILIERPFGGRSLHDGLISCSSTLPTLSHPDG